MIRRQTRMLRQLRTMELAAGGLLLMSILVAAGAVYANGLAGCVGDCNGCGSVEINELVRGVNIVLERADLNQCPSFDANDSGTVEINELVQAVKNVLEGCPSVPMATATPSPTGTNTPTQPSMPTGTPNLPIVAGGSTIVVNVMSVVPSIVAAIANGFEFGSGAGAGLSGNEGGGHAACPLGGTATRAGQFIPPNLLITLSACRVETMDGFVTFDGTVSVTGLNFSVDISARFEDGLGMETLTAQATIMGTVAGIPSLGGNCEIRSLQLRVTSGTISATKVDSPSAAVMFTDTSVTIDNILFLVPECVPEAYRMTFNGAAALLAGEGEPIGVTFNQLRIEVDGRVEPATFNISGGMTSPCFGGAATFSTAPLLAVPDDEVCPVAGTITATFTGGMSRIHYRSDLSVDIDRGADDTIDDTAPNCLDRRLLECAA